MKDLSHCLCASESAICYFIMSSRTQCHGYEWWCVSMRGVWSISFALCCLSAPIYLLKTGMESEWLLEDWKTCTLEWKGGYILGYIFVRFVACSRLYFNNVHLLFRLPVVVVSTLSEFLFKRCRPTSQIVFLNWRTTWLNFNSRQQPTYCYFDQKLCSKL